jgi:hypothetical protein
VIVGAVALTVMFVLPRLFGGIGALFDEQEVDRSGPVLLQAISELNDYDAAAANLQVMVDLERDTRYVPRMLKGERTKYLASGVARAGVSFSNVSPERVVVDPVTKTVTITLPHARITGVTLDPSRSEVVSHQRGLVDRIGSALGDTTTVDQRLIETAQLRLQRAATESAVIAEAERNTRHMLTTLATSLGHERVTVVFVDEASLVTTGRPGASSL